MLVNVGIELRSINVSCFFCVIAQGSSSISSIVDQNLIECDLRQQKARENSLATLSVVSANQHHPGHSEMMKDGVVYLQVRYMLAIFSPLFLMGFRNVFVSRIFQMPSAKEPSRDHDTGTLDLSMKKPRSPEFVNNHMVHSTQSMHMSAVSKNSNSHPHIPLIPVPPHQPHMYKHPSAHETANSSYYPHPQVR